MTLAGILVSIIVLGIIIGVIIQFADSLSVSRMYCSKCGLLINPLDRLNPICTCENDFVDTTMDIFSNFDWVTGAGWIGKIVLLLLLWGLLTLPSG